MSLKADIHRATTWSVALSVLMVVAGVAAIFLPGLAGFAVTAIVGWLFAFSGVLHLAFAWRKGTASTVLWEVLLGVVYGAIGIYIMINPLAGLQSLTIAVAIYLVIESVLEVLLWLELSSAPGGGWLLLDGIITMVLAILIWTTWPSSAIWVIGTLAGISAFFSGITRLMLSLSVRRLVA